MKVARPILFCVRTSTIWVATVSLSTTMWNSWLPAVTSTAVCKFGLQLNSSSNTPCTPLQYTQLVETSTVWVPTVSLSIAVWNSWLPAVTSTAVCRFSLQLNRSSNTPCTPLRCTQLVLGCYYLRGHSAHVYYDVEQLTASSTAVCRFGLQLNSSSNTPCTPLQCIQLVETFTGGVAVVSLSTASGNS